MVISKIYLSRRMVELFKNIKYKYINAITKLNSELNINNTNTSAKIISFLAQNGDIKIERANIYGENGVTMA